MKIVSLFSGVGGLDLACERAFNGETVTQVECEPYALRVLERHWPNTERHHDVTTYTGEPCDVVCGGFPCTDLSVAGKRAGLDGEKSGLYRELMRVVEQAQPRYVVVENVPPLLAYRGRVDTDFASLGYGTVWQVCEASDVGAPHRRQRVFIVAVRGLPGSRMLARPSPQGDLFAPAFAAALWPAATTGDRTTMCQQGGEPLGHAVRWPTPAAADGSGSRSGGAGTSETGRRPDGTKATIGLQAAARAWPTPRAAFDAGRGSKGDESLMVAARWPTPTHSDGSGGPGRSGRSGGDNLRTSTAWPTPTLCGNDNRKGASKTSGDGLATATKSEDQAPGVLNPAWVDLLMGLPSGWTALDGELGEHIWPAGRGQPQHDVEPPRLVPPKSTPHRSARLKALGNAVVWQQAHAAIVRALGVCGAFGR